MGSGRRRTKARWGLGSVTALFVVAWLAVMGIAGWALDTSQDASRRQVAARVDARTRYAASFVSIYASDLLIRERAAAQSLLAGPRVSPAELRRWRPRLV